MNYLEVERMFRMLFFVVAVFLGIVIVELCKLSHQETMLERAINDSRASASNYIFPQDMWKNFSG